MISVFPNNFDLPNGKYTFTNENFTVQKRKTDQQPRDYYVIEKKDNKYTQIEPKPIETNTIRLIDFSPMEKPHRRKKENIKQCAFVYIKKNRFGLLYELLPFNSSTITSPSTKANTDNSLSSSTSSTSSTSSSTSTSSTTYTPNSNNENDLSDFFESDSD